MSGPWLTFSPHVQGVSRTLVENSRTLRLPTHLHERLGLIRNAKMRLEEKGINPSVNVSSVQLQYIGRRYLNTSHVTYEVDFEILLCFLLTGSCSNWSPEYSRIPKYVPEESQECNWGIIILWLKLVLLIVQENVSHTFLFTGKQQGVFTWQGSVSLFKRSARNNSP